MKLGLFINTHRRNYNRIQASNWIRVLQMIEYYKKLGIQVSLNKTLGRRYDVAILYRGIDKRSYRKIVALRKISKKVYWDQCVNYFEDHGKVVVRQLEVAKKISKVVDGIIISTKFIGDRAKKLNKNIFLMPDPVDTEFFNLEKEAVNFVSPQFIWSGSSLKIEPLNKYSEEINNKITLITDKKIKRLNLKFNAEVIFWKYKNFRKDILRGDVCFAPRETNNLYDLGHSSFKILIFANSKIPIIANKLPSYVKLSEFYNGIEFLEDNDNSIKKCLNKLKYRKFDNVALLKEYSCEAVSTKLIDFLKRELKK